MERYDLVVKGGRAVLPGGIEAQVDIGVRSGKIAAISSDRLTGAQVIDATHQVVIPGVVDEHFHVFLGYPWENFPNATAGALKGGVTTVIDMPLDNPAPLTGAAIREKRDMVKRECRCDFALYGGYLQGRPEEMENQAGEHVAGFKLFTDGAAPPGMYPGVDAGEQLEAMAVAARLGRTVAVHCENAFIIDQLSETLRAQGRLDGGVWDEARPVIAEIDAIRRTVSLASHTGARTVVVHVSVAEGADIVHKARSQGHPIWVETCPHYLLITKEDMDRDIRFKWNPPSRSRPLVDQLWEAVRRGWVQTIGSDHANLGKTGTDIWSMAPGAPGVETMLTTVMTEAVWERDVSLSQVVDLLCANPAQVYGLYPRKGCIAVGADADLVLLNWNTERRIDASKLEILGTKWSPFDGRLVRVHPTSTILRGQVVMQDDHVLATPGHGEFVPAFVAQG